MIDRVGNHLRQAAAEVRRFEDVLEDPFDIDPGTFVRIDAECAKTKVERANVVETEEVSTRIVLPACSTTTETRRRLSCGSSEVQVSHSQPIDGTPVEVPVPRNVSFIAHRCCRCRRSAQL